MTITEAKQKYIDMALSFDGYHEKASNKDLDSNTNNGTNNWNRFARDVDACKGWMNGNKNIGPRGEWCCMYVCGIALYCWGYPTARKFLYMPEKALGAACKYAANYYKQNNAWYTEPEVGDQIFFRYSTEIAHTGIVWKVTTAYVFTIEGNSQDMVQKKQYAKTNKSIAGYGRPDWKLVAEADPNATPAPVAHPTLRKGSKGQAVKDLQNMLIKHGYSLPRYGADGDFGSETDAAVRAYQRDHKLEVDGIVGPLTWASLEQTKPAVMGDGQRYKLYTIKPGDTLTKIATAHNVSRDGLVLLNEIKNPNLIRVGEVLRIPV